MSMRMTATQLRALADTLDGMAKVSGLEVSCFKSSNHDVRVEKSTDRRDGNTYFVVGITNNGLKNLFGGPGA